MIDRIELVVMLLFGAVSAPIMFIILGITIVAIWKGDGDL